MRLRKKAWILKQVQDDKKLYVRIMVAFMDIIRPLFGFQNRCCIYPVSCSDYAKELLATRPIWYAVPRIILRVLSCNPINALIRKYRNK